MSLIKCVDKLKKRFTEELDSFKMNSSDNTCIPTGGCGHPAGGGEAGEDQRCAERAASTTLQVQAAAAADMSAFPLLSSWTSHYLFIVSVLPCCKGFLQRGAGLSPRDRVRRGSV